MNISISHLLCFVLIVFSINVLVLAYLTGALSGIDYSVVSHFTESVSQRIKKLKQRAPTRPLPPWERTSITVPHEVCL
jgi:hypothetical protein